MIHAELIGMPVHPTGLDPQEFGDLFHGGAAPLQVFLFKPTARSGDDA
jgi:hypothetical protein